MGGLGSDMSSFISPDNQTLIVLSSVWDYHLGFYPLQCLVTACALGIQAGTQILMFQNLQKNSQIFPVSAVTLCLVVGFSTQSQMVGYCSTIKLNIIISYNLGLRRVPPFLPAVLQQRGLGKSQLEEGISVLCHNLRHLEGASAATELTVWLL